MRGTHRELTAKHKAFCFPVEPLFLSRQVRTFFNKFTKQGKKLIARRHIMAALTSYRYQLRRPRMFYSLIRLFRRLHIQFILVSKRKGRKLISVPFPVRRNKRDVLNLQTIYKAMIARRERTLTERIQLELLALTFNRRTAATMRDRNDHLTLVHTERVNMEARWK